jgi:hypothetical protein
MPRFVFNDFNETLFDGHFVRPAKFCKEGTSRTAAYNRPSNALPPQKILGFCIIMQDWFSMGG